MHFLKINPHSKCTYKERPYKGRQPKRRHAPDRTWQWVQNRYKRGTPDLYPPVKAINEKILLLLAIRPRFVGLNRPTSRRHFAHKTDFTFMHLAKLAAAALLVR